MITLVRIAVFIIKCTFSFGSHCMRFYEIVTFVMILGCYDLVLVHTAHFLWPSQFLMIKIIIIIIIIIKKNPSKKKEQINKCQPFFSWNILFHFKMSHYVSKMGCGCHFMMNLKAWGEWVYKWVATWRDSVIMPSGAVCHFHGGKPLWSGVENGFAHKKGVHKCSAKQSSNEGLFFTVRIFQCTVPPGRSG